MAKRNYSDFDDENENYGTGKYINDGSLFDKHDNEDDTDDDDDNASDIDDDDDEKRPPYANELEDFVDEESDAEEKPKKKRGNLKPKLIGKHSLTYDTIFKGKQNVAITEVEYQSEHIIKNGGGSLDINDSDLESEESRNNIDSYREIRLKQEVCKLLKANTDINFTANRRKPAKTDFNAYFDILLKDLIQYGYTRTEIFVELSGYFSDNIWNMFQLLDKQFSNIIIRELKEKYGLSDMDKIDFLG
jgi:hypothetical protein